VAKTLQVDVDNLYISQPGNGEEALEILDTLVNSHSLEIIVVDSVAALVPKSELEGNYGDAQMGVQARLMSQAMRKLAATISKSGTTVIFINQLRHKIGGYGNPETTTGGNALKFYSTIRIDIRKVDLIKRGEDILGHVIKAKIAKNKVAPPFKVCHISFYYDRGYDNCVDILDLAVTHKVVQKSGTWYSYNEERLGQGRENSSVTLKESPKLFQEIEKSIRKILGFNQENEKSPERKVREVKKEEPKKEENENGKK